ncbi:radical SAM protein [Candidatus Thorarchaeota archaeon]|nr:MAG: radical SAM protein [Candidatus Thorarchaeota archaeon]
MMKCPNHSDEKQIASKNIGYCGNCLIGHPERLRGAEEAHESLREKMGLVPKVSRDGETTCAECGNHCRLENGELGFCGLRTARAGRIIERYQDSTIISWYRDPLPTNCVADWVCPVREQRYTINGKRRHNLAVFYGSCNSDCFFCQNSSYKDMMRDGRPLMTPDQLASMTDETTACLCFFGGDPSCNAEHSIETARRAKEITDVTICYETNGNISKKWLQPIADIVQRHGGTIKFDLKAVSGEIYTALTGISNSTVLRNFQVLAKRGRNCDGEFLVASILLVPGYVGTKEVRRVSQFIADCDDTIPTALLGFQPHHWMRDLPRTSRRHAERAKEVAEEAGLKNVRIGNRGLLSRVDYHVD